jgi:hypothetical protein
MVSVRKRSGITLRLWYVAAGPQPHLVYNKEVALFADYVQYLASTHQYARISNNNQGDPSNTSIISNQ